MSDKNNRKFKRYNSNSACEVTFPSVTYKGKVIDYSDGASVVIADAPDVVRGTEINVRIPDQGVEFKGEVVWTNRVADHLQAGIRRVESLKGSLGNFRLIDILIGAYRSKTTGILQVQSRSIVKKICIASGEIFFAASNDEDEHLGEYLLTRGNITLAELENATDRMMKSQQKLGETLVECGCLTPQELVQEVQNHVEDIIISLFSLEEGEFELKEGSIILDDSITLQSSTPNLIYHGIKKIRSYSFIKKLCPSTKDILNISLNPMMIVRSLELDNNDKKILSHINGLYPLERILALSPASNFTTLKTICALMIIGLIHIKEDDEDPVALPLDDIFGNKKNAARLLGKDTPGTLEKKGSGLE